MSSDQKFTTITSTGQVKTISGGTTNMGPCRVTYIQCEGVASSKLILRDSSDGSGNKETAKQKKIRLKYKVDTDTIGEQ